MKAHSPATPALQVKTCLVMRDLPHQGANTRHTASHSADGQSAAEDATLQCDHTEPDVVVLSQASDQPPAAPTHLYTLRVIVHPTYQVPALYLVGRRTGGGVHIATHLSTQCFHDCSTPPQPSCATCLRAL